MNGLITDRVLLLQAVRKLLPEYLEKKGVRPNSSGKFICLNPDHDDKTPSMNLTPDHMHVKCHGCQALYDIVDLNMALSGLNPKLANASDTVEHIEEIATAFGIPFQLQKLTAEDIRRLQYISVYNKIGEMLLDTRKHKADYSDEVIAYVKERKWSPATLAVFGIGCLSSESIRASGIIPTNEDPDLWMQKMDLYRPSPMNIFQRRNLIIPWNDERGNIVGFFGRNCAYTPDSEVPKYTSSSSTTVPTFDKGGMLFNFHRAKQFLRDTRGDTIYLVEGHPNVITMYQNGIPNVVAVGGVALTDKHCELLKKLKVGNIIICMDGDGSGIRATRKILNEQMSKFIGVKIQVINLPSEHDPDSYIREHGIDMFNQLPRVNAFEWLLKDLRDHAAYEVDVDSRPGFVAKQLIPIVASFSSAIDREIYAQKLSLETGISTMSLLEDIASIVNVRENSIRNQLLEVAATIPERIKKTPDLALSILEEAVSATKSIEASYASDIYGGDFFASQLDHIRDGFDQADNSFPGFQLPFLPLLAEAFNNDWSNGKFIALGGDENCGKTSFETFLIANLIYEEKNNLRAFLMTIDDSVQEIVPKFISIFGRLLTQDIEEGGFPLEINHIVRPAYWAGTLDTLQPGRGKVMLEAYRRGFEHLRRLAKEERLIIGGIPQIQTLQDFRRGLAKLRNRYGTDNIYAHLDNAHKLPLPNGDARLGFKEVSNNLKNYSVEYACTVGATLEYNTNEAQRGKDGRPTNNSLAESRAFRYDANALLHVYNNLHVKQGEALFFHVQRNPYTGEGQRLPIVELILGKNKISGDKSPKFMKFFPGSCWFEEMTTTQAVREAKLKEQILKDGGQLLDADFLNKEIEADANRSRFSRTEELDFVDHHNTTKEDDDVGGLF